MTGPMHSRRSFLRFFGRASATLSVAGLAPAAVQAQTSSGEQVQKPKKLSTAKPSATSTKPPFTPLTPMSVDTVMLAKGFTWKPLISWGDVISADGATFGFNNDFIAFIQNGASPDEGILWVNHESTNPLFVSGWTKGAERTKEQVIKEQMSVGGSLLRVRKDDRGDWTVVPKDPLNRRVDGRSRIPFASPRPILGAREATGTLANCAGGVTPWKTILTCEENYDGFYGEAYYEFQARNRRAEPSRLMWEKYFDNPPEHYGWVVEVNPLTGAAKKLTALGRFAHECATTTTAKDGRCVVYSGDDGDDRCLYKFISEKPGSLETGTLHVASLGQKKWIPLVFEQNEILRKHFTDQTDVLIRCREAAQLVGGSPLDRPEDVEIDPKTGAVIVALTNNLNRGVPHGSLLKISEKGADPLATEFEFETLLLGGDASGVSCPDNLCFDRKGNLWVTTDVSGKLMNKPPYEKFGNNSLFYIPMSGANAGRAFLVASAPHDAEFTGPCFSPDGRTLFLSVQHPGEESKGPGQYTSSWPGGGSSTPKPSVITIQGPALDALVL